MGTRDWSSTEFVAAAVVLVGVWTTGLSTGADRTWTLAVTTGLTVVYVLASGFQNRQSTRPPWSRSELFVAGGQVLAVAAAAAAGKQPVSTALVAVALTIASYVVVALVRVARGVRPATVTGSGSGTPSLGMALMPYDLPLSAATHQPPDRAAPSSPVSGYHLRIERRAGASVSVYTSSRSGGSLPIAHRLSGEQLAQFVEARTGTPIADRVRVLHRLESGCEFVMRKWHAEEDDVLVARIQYEPETGEAILMGAADEQVVRVEAPTGEAAEDLEWFQWLLAQSELSLHVRNLGARTALLRAELQ